MRKITLEYFKHNEKTDKYIKEEKEIELPDKFDWYIDNSCLMCLPTAFLSKWLKDAKDFGKLIENEINKEKEDVMIIKIFDMYGSELCIL